jgi:hypothetical protein
MSQVRREVLQRSAVWALACGLAVAACRTHAPPSGADGGPGGSMPPPATALDLCLEQNGWSAQAAQGPLDDRDLAVAVAAVQARCQPSPDDLDAYVGKLAQGAR